MIGAALRATLAQGADDWQKPWALLCGLAHFGAPNACRRGRRDHPAERLPEFPDIKDPLETALAEAEQFAEPTADRRLEPGPGRSSRWLGTGR